VKYPSEKTNKIFSIAILFITFAAIFMYAPSPLALADKIIGSFKTIDEVPDIFKLAQRGTMIIGIAGLYFCSGLVPFLATYFILTKDKESLFPEKS